MGSFVSKKFNFIFGKLNSLSFSNVVFRAAQISPVRVIFIQNFSIENNFPSNGSSHVSTKHFSVQRSLMRKIRISTKITALLPPPKF